MTQPLPPQVCIARASAGSGKTYALARQYISLLINSSHLEDLPFREILAITFTNKASLEMKGRILELLKTRALGNKEALLLMDQIIRNYHFFQVKTIDSFIKSLLSGCVFKMDFSSGFRIKEDYTESLAYSIDKVIDKTGQERKIYNAFVKFLKQYLYVENRANWFLKRDILSTMEAMFSLSNIYGDGFRKSDVKDTGLIIKKKQVLKDMKRLKDSAPEGARQSFLKSLKSFLDKTRDSFDIDAIPNSFIRPEFPLNKGYTLAPEARKLWNKIKSGLKEVCELESLILLNPYIDIFDMVSDVFKSLTTRDDIIFLEELNRQAKGIFDEGTMTLGEIYYRLAARFRHYLIDEFQDTSCLQWKNLIPMVEEALSSGGTLFCVGDKKQAIYRFRGGDSSLLEYVEDRFKKFNVEHKTLNMNFRSHKEIVEFNNEVFSEKNLKKFFQIPHQRNAGFTPAEEDEILRVFEDSRQSHKEENAHGYVSIERIEAQDKKERQSIIKDKIIALVQQLSTRGFSYEDIAILLRDNDEVELVTGWLLKRGIPVESAKTLSIKEHPYIKEIISFLKFLNSPVDNLSFSSFILGEIFTQASNLTKAQMQEFLFEIRRKDVYTEFKKRYPEAWDNLFDRFFKSVGFVPLYEFTVGILSRFNVMERFSESQGFFMRFLELIKEQEEVNASIPLFLDFFDKLEGNDLYVDIIDSKYVKALTIHKSKGLEFPVVIIPFLAMDIRIGMRNKGYSFTVYPGDNGLELRRLKKQYGNFSKKLYALYREEYKKSFIDELNNIYVAFTRAKNELYIFVPERKVNTDLASQLIPARGRKVEFGMPSTTAPPARGASKVVKIPPSKYSDWTPFLKDEFIDVSQIKNRDKLLKGEILHYILSFIGDLSRVSSAEAIKYAMERASLRFPFFVIARNEAISIIEKLLKDKKLKRFFFVEDGVACQEKEIINHFGETYRIDRLIVKERSVWVVDYKSSKDEKESSRKQIHRYINTVRDLYPGRDVTGFLIFLDDFSVEEIYE